MSSDKLKPARITSARAINKEEFGEIYEEYTALCGNPWPDEAHPRIYVVEEGSCQMGDHSIIGLFSSEEKAREAKEAGDEWNRSIMVLPLDPTPDQYREIIDVL